MQTAIESSAATDVAKRKRLVLVDGSGYIFRAYHALPPLTRPDGTPVGAVYGFTTMLMKTLEDGLHPDYGAVIFDAARQTFRNDIYPDYKANRADTPEDLIPQFSIVREATKALNLPSIEMDRYEADDLIASYARRAVEAGMEVIIVSSDKDLMQLVDDHISLFEPMKSKHIGYDQVMEKFGVPPEQVTQVQALIGDSVDNVPGVPGIGPKTAAQLIEQFGSLDAILERAGEIKQPKRRESLIEHAASARMSFELVTLKDDISLPIALENLVMREPEADALLPFLQAQNFKTLLSKMEQKLGAKAPEVETTSTQAADGAAFGEYELVQDADALNRWIERATSAGYVAIDTETTSLNAMQAELVGISLATAPGEACYIPLGHVSEAAGEAADLFSQDTHAKPVEGQLPLQEALDAIKPLLADRAVLKIGQNIKYDLLVLQRYGVDVTPVDDTMLLSYVEAAGLHAHNMDDLSQLHLGHKPIPFKEVCGSGKSQITFAQVPLDKACDYAAEDADITLRLWLALKPQLVQEQVATVYETIERPLLPTIVKMERNGIKANPDFLKALSNEFALQIQSLEEVSHQLAGRPFNVASPKQLGEILYDEMGLEGGKKSSKTGAYSTGAEVLEELALQGHELPEKVLQYRQLAKLKSTYTDTLAGQINPKTGRIHTSFSLAAANTGRLSSSDPNLQNIPIRTTEGRRIREAFVADEGNLLISADYSQIELRLLAHIANIEVLREAFANGADIHATTASQMFGVPVDQVDSELRRKAKTINFGIIYGISAHGLAARLGIGRGEAKTYIDAYFEQYPGIRKYMERTKEAAREQGYVTTLYGRKVHLKDINAKNPNMRAFSERAAINAPLQGTAADIIKRAMVAVDAALAQQFPDAKLLLQVHDELIVEAPKGQAEQVGALVASVMMGAADLSVPLLVEAESGSHWGAVH